MFINFTNHPSPSWSETQLTAAQSHGKVVDIPFPNIDPNSTNEDILTLAQDYAQRIAAMSPKAVLCQGEFVFAFAIVTELKKRGISIVAACSQRCSIEHTDGKVTKKVTEFRFIQLREY